jgi:hypothetical protein
MDHLYTRSGRVLQRFGADLFSRSGHYLGHLHNGKVFDSAGRYSGTVVGDRIVYRTIDSAATSTPATAADRPASTLANHTGSSVWGREPSFAD